MSYTHRLRTILILLMAIGLAAALFFKESDRVAETNAPIALSPETQAGPEAIPEAPPALSSQEPMDSVQSDYAAPERTPITPPMRDHARKEVAENPHAAPKSLLNFANQIADRFDEVEKYPDQADHFMNELEECVRDSGNRMLSARALCLTNAEDLAAMFPQFSDRLNQLRASAPQDVADLARASSAGFED